MPKICPACQTENRDSAKFCRLCGSPLPKEDSSPTAQNGGALVQNDELSAQNGESPAFAQAASVLQPATNLQTITEDTEIIGLSQIRSQLEMFISTLKIRQKQKKIGMPVSAQTNILVFRGETGTGKSLVAEWFIGLPFIGKNRADDLAQTFAALSIRC